MLKKPIQSQFYSIFVKVNKVVQAGMLNCTIESEKLKYVSSEMSSYILTHRHKSNDLLSLLFFIAFKR